MIDEPSGDGRRIAGFAKFVPNVRWNGPTTDIRFLRLQASEQCKHRGARRLGAPQFNFLHQSDNTSLYVSIFA